MNVQTAIQDRYSVRSFDCEKKIPEEVVSQIIEAARVAPSAHNKQPFSIIRLKSDDARNKISQCYDRTWFRDASDVLMVVGEEEEAWVYNDGRNSALYVDAAIATTFMQLQAWELGVGSVWVCAFDREKACELFGLEMGKRTPVTLLVLGYAPDTFEPRPRVRKSTEEIYREI